MATTRRRWWVAAPVVAVMVGLVALVTPASAVAPVPVGVPDAAQSNTTSYPVLQRLGRWNGATFDPVAAGSVPAGHLVVMSHGWSPGYRSSYEQLQATTDHLVDAWDPALVDASGQSMMSRFEALAAALQQADPTATVVMFSWVDQSSTGTSVFDASGPELATEVNGHRLATAIDEALSPGFAAGGGLIHLIGHSFGANVVTTAALALSTPPRQVTLLDSPEVELTRLGGAKNDLRYKLPLLSIGRAPGEVFVDNYISAVGERYSTDPGLAAVVDVQTRPPDEDIGDQHSFAIDWYTDSVAATDPQVGYGWSPLIGADDDAVGTYYEQPAVDAPLQLTQVEGPPDPTVAAHLATTTVLLAVAGAGADVLDVAGDGTGPLTSNLTFSTDDDSLWLTFDEQLSGRAGDLVTVWIDGRQRSQFAVTDDGTGAAGAFVILYDEAPGSHLLSVTVSGPTPDQAADPTTRASLTGLAVTSTSGITRNLTATETYHLAAAVVASGVAGVIALLGLVALVVVLLVRHRRRRRSEADAETEAEAEADADAGAVPLITEAVGGGCQTWPSMTDDGGTGRAERELDHLREPIDSGEELPGRAANRREISLVTFFLVVLVVEGFDLLLTTRLRFADTLHSTASTVASGLDTAGDVLFALFGLLAVLTLVAARRRTPRFALPVMVGYLVVATVNVVADVATLVGTAHLEQAGELSLLWDIGLVYLATTLVYSLWYQLADAYLPGGAIDFPPNGAHPDDVPRWFDYLFLSFNTNATFGPTTEGVRTRPTKALMMSQSAISVVVLVVLIARVVGLAT